MTQEQILSRLLSQISDEFDKSVGSFFYDVDKSVAGEIALIDARVEEILKNGFAMTASGKYLDNKVAEQGIKRKEATHSVVNVTITGTPGAIISLGMNTQLDEVGRGMLSSPLDRKHDRTTSGVGCAQGPWTILMVG